MAAARPKPAAEPKPDVVEDALDVAEDVEPPPVAEAIDVPEAPARSAYAVAALGWAATVAKSTSDMQDEVAALRDGHAAFSADLAPDFADAPTHRHASRVVMAFDDLSRALSAVRSITTDLMAG